MSTEQTGRHDLDSSDSQTRIEPSSIVASPQGGDPTPLPRRRAAVGTRTGMKALPPPIPDGTRPKLAAAPRATTVPPPIPGSKSDIDIGVLAASEKARAADPDGWSLPATIEPSGPSYPSVYHPEPAAPDITVPLTFDEAVVAAPLEDRPSKEWLDKISSVLKDESAEDAERIAAAHALALAATAEANAAREKAEAAARAEADAIARAEAEIRVRNEARAARKAAQAVDDGERDAPTDRDAEAEAEAVALAKANAAANAVLPKLPTARPSGARLPAPRSSSGTRPPLPLGTPVPAVAAAAAAMFTTNAAAPSLTSPLELVDLEAVESTGTPAAGAALVAPVATPVMSPLVAAAQASMDIEVEWDSTPDMTSAHTTDFEMPVKSKVPQRAVLGLLVAATFASVGYLATRSTSKPKHIDKPVAAQAAPAPVAAEQPAAAQPAPAPAAPVAQAVAAPAAAEQPTAAPIDQPKAGGQLIQMPVSSTPSGALVTFVDGEKAEIVGRTPTTITLDASKPHDIALTLVGHETQLEHVPVGGMTALAVTLPTKAGAPATETHAAAPREQHVAAMVPAHEETAPARHAKASHPAPVEHITAPAPRTETAPSGAGILMISSKPPCEIIVDGKSTHLQTPQKALPLPAGTHTIMLVNAGMKIHKTVAVDIVAKKPTKLIQDFTKH